MRGRAGSLAVTGSGRSRQLGVQVSDGLCRTAEHRRWRTNEAAGAGPLEVLGQVEVKEIGPRKQCLLSRRQATTLYLQNVFVCNYNYGSCFMMPRELIIHVYIRKLSIFN